MSAFLIISAIFALSTNAPASETEIQKLLAGDGTAKDYFGRSVSISGDQAIVGAHGDGDNGSLSGSAYVFERIGGVWTEVAKLSASDGAAGDEFARSVSISGDQAIVGAYADDDNGRGSGSAYVFERIGGVWTEVAKLIASDGAVYDYFGRTLSLSGDQAIVGAYSSSPSSAYVFERIGGVWTEVAKLIASDGARLDYFGISVSLSGDQAIVGAFGDEDNGSASGSAYVFERIGGVWTEVAKLIASEGGENDRFGSSVSLSGDQAIVGAYSDDDNGRDIGSAYVFERIGGVWTEVAKLSASDGASYDYFGSSVSLSGDQAIVGAYGNDGNGRDTGSVYVFERIGGVWTEVAKLIASDGARDDDFGRTVSLSYGQAIVGAVFDDDNGSNSGSAYMYKLFQTPAEVVQDLILDVEYFNLPGGLENAMVSKLERAIVSLENGLDDVATNQMYAFIHMVEAQRDKKIADELADEWIAAGQWIIDSIQSE